jgi:GMP synthase-like glutamine amidotransferase
MTRKPVLVFVNNYKDREKGRKALSNIARCTGHPLQMIDHAIPNLAEKVSDLEPDLVFLSGSEHLLSRPTTKQAFQGEIDLVKNPAFPILGICFGHQLIGIAYGTEMSDMGLMVRRFEPVTVLDHHQIFDGLPSIITVAESHRQTLNEVPEGFLRLAFSASSNIEAICHESMPVYGLQFHPERSDEEHPHGRAIIRNLLNLAGQAMA